MQELCPTCLHVKSCSVYDKFSDPIIYCEHYKPKDGTPGKSASSRITELMGLCINCEMRFICLFPKPEGGVWHCEEYQ